MFRSSKIHRYLVHLGVILMIIVLIVTSLFRSTSPLFAGGGQPPVTLSLRPSSSTIQPGGTFTVAVALDMQASSHAISTITLVLSFDANVLQATAFSPNTSALPQLQVLEQSTLGSGTGTAGITFGTGSDPASAIQNSATIATITFKAVGSSGSSSSINWNRAEALSVSSWDESSENVVGTTNNASLCIGTCGSPDTTPPTVSWISPVTAEGQVYSATSGTVTIEVAAADDSSGVGNVHFFRWDAVNQVFVDLATITAPPYRTSVAVNTLNSGFNEIDADAVDNAGNSTHTYFWIDRASQPTELLANPGFEDDTNPVDGKPDKWSTSSKFTRLCNSTNPPPVQGSCVGKFSATDNSGVTIKQTVNVVAGTAYTFGSSVNIPAQKDTTFSLKIQVQWKNSSGSTIRTDTIQSYTKATAGWNTATKSVTAPTGAVKAIVLLKVTSLNGTMYVDNFSFHS